MKTITVASDLDRYCVIQCVTVLSAAVAGLALYVVFSSLNSCEDHQICSITEFIPLM